VITVFLKLEWEGRKGWNEKKKEERREPTPKISTPHSFTKRGGFTEFRGVLVGKVSKSSSFLPKGGREKVIPGPLHSEM